MVTLKSEKYSLVEFFYIFTFTLYLFSIYTISDISFIFELIFYAAIVGYTFFCFRKIKFTFYLYWQIFFLIICAVTLVGSYDISQSMIEIRKLLRIFIIGNSLISFIDSPKKILTFYNIFVLAGVYLLFDVLLNTPTSEWFTRRLGSLEYGYNANLVGLALSISIIFSFYLGHQSKKNRYYILIPILIVAVLLTGSRKSLVLAFSGIAGSLYLKSDGLTKKIKITLIVIILFCLGYYMIMNIPFLYEITGSRIESLLNSVFGEAPGDGSTQIRTQMINVGVELFQDRPINGYGIGAYARVSGFDTYSHNNYIELLVSTGFFGLVIYYFSYVFLLVTLFKKIRNRNPIVIPLFVLVILLIVLETGLVTYNEMLYQLIIIMSFASLRAIKNDSESKVEG